MFFIFAYITGGIIIALSLINFIFPGRKVSLFIKAGLDFTTIINCLFIYLATGNSLIIVSVVTNIIATVRDILFNFRNKYKCLNNYAWPILFCVLNISSLIFTYKSLISLIPIIGSVISTSTLYANDQKITKIGAIFAQSCYLTYYSILLPSSSILTIFSLISTAAGIVGTVIGLVVLKREKEKFKSEAQTNK